MRRSSTTKTNQLCLGLESDAADVLELATPTTAELPRRWFGEDVEGSDAVDAPGAPLEPQQIIKAVKAFRKISGNRPTFARLRYVKDDGLAAFYSPDCLVRTASATYLVETKAQQQTIHPNVQRKLKAAVAWCERINQLAPEHRGGLPWHYVLLAEDTVYEWQGKGARLVGLLDFARLRPLFDASLQERLL